MSSLPPSDLGMMWSSVGERMSPLTHSRSVGVPHSRQVHWSRSCTARACFRQRWGRLRLHVVEQYVRAECQRIVRPHVRQVDRTTSHEGLYRSR